MTSTYAPTQGAGALLSLAASGSIEQSLYTNPRTNETGSTLFRQNFKKHLPSAFELQSKGLTDGSGTTFGNEASITVDKSFDVLGQTFLTVTLPAIYVEEGFVPKANPKTTGRFGVWGNNACNSCAQECPTESCAGDAGVQLVGCNGAAVNECYVELDDNGNKKPFAYYCNCIGFALTKDLKLWIGNQEIDKYSAEWMYAWDELFGASDKTLHAMAGKHSDFPSLVCQAQCEFQVNVPLSFFFFRSPTNYLHLSALQYHHVMFKMHFRPLEQLVCVSEDGVEPKFKTSSKDKVDGRLKYCAIYLSTEERDFVAQNSFQQVITQTQLLSGEKAGLGATFQTPLYFNLAIKSLTFAFRSQCNTDANNYFNFSYCGSDPIHSAAVHFNNQPRVSEEAVALRTIMPYCCASRVPNAFIYLMPFALDTHGTEDHATGSVNFSRLDNTVAKFSMKAKKTNLDPNIDPSTYWECFIFGENYNIITFANGVAGLKYAS